MRIGILYLYAGILLMLPSLQRMTEGMDKRDYIYYFGISSLFFGLWLMMVHYFPDMSLWADFQLPLYNSYICMLLIGNYMKKCYKRFRWKNFGAVVFFVGAVSVNVILTYTEYMVNETSYLFLIIGHFYPY